MVYKLQYFPIRGKAETARLIALVGGLKVEDDFVNGQLTPEAKEKLPFGQLPVLTDTESDFVLAQSLSIFRYLAKEANLYPTDAKQAAISDSLVDTIEEWRNAMLKSLFSNEMEQFLSGKHQEYLKLFEQMLKKAGGKYFIGGSLSWVDLFAYEAFDTFSFNDMTDWTNYPTLKNLCNFVENLPELKEHMKNRLGLVPPSMMDKFPKKKE